MEVLLSPIAHIRGSCKFVIDSVLLFLRRRLLEKKKIKCWGSLLSAYYTIKLDSGTRFQTESCLSVFHWMANNLDGFWNAPAFCSIAWPRLVWSGTHLYTPAQPRMAGEQSTHILGCAVWIGCCDAVSLSPCPFRWEQSDCWSCKAVNELWQPLDPPGRGCLGARLWGKVFLQALTQPCVLSSLWSLGCAIPWQEGAGSHAAPLSSPGDHCFSQAGVTRK